MKSTDITFSQIAEKRYLSDAIQVNSETIGLQLEFKESGKLAVYISYDGEKYSVVETKFHYSEFRPSRCRSYTRTIHQG